MTTTDPAALSVSASPRMASGSEPARSASTEMGSSVPGGADFGDCPLSVSDLDLAPADAGFAGVSLPSDALALTDAAWSSWPTPRSAPAASASPASDEEPDSGADSPPA